MIILSKWLNGSIWSVDGTLTGSTSSSRNGSGCNSNKGTMQTSQTQRLMPHHQMQFNLITMTLNGFRYYYLTLIILFDNNHTVKLIQVYLSNLYSSICTQLKSLKYCYRTLSINNFFVYSYMVLSITFSQ